MDIGELLINMMMMNMKMMMKNMKMMMMLKSNHKS